MIFKQNLAALAKKNPQLAQAVADAPLTGRYKLIASQRKDGLPTLVDMKFNRSYYNNIDPYMAVKAELNDKKILLPDVAVFLGFGAGYHAKEYLNRYPKARILVFEKDAELLKTVMMHFANLKELFLNPSFSIIGGKPLNQLYPDTFNFFNVSDNLGYLKSVNFIENFAAISCDKEFYLGSIQTVREAIRGVLALYGNDPYDSLLGIKYTLRNISTIIDSPGVKDLEGIFKDKPGVVVATGPSLNKNVKLLEGIYNKAVIVAVDGSVKVLKKHGLKPAHMVTSLERVVATSKLFEGLTPEDVKDSYLAACPVVVPETYANFPGEKIIIYRNFATFQWLDIPKGILNIGPSSANMAFKLLEFLGCDPIIIIGQDLAYGENDVSHADGFHYGEEFETAKAANALKVPGNYAPFVKTSPVWHSFLKHYERDLAEHHGRVINATEGGAKIQGTEVMTFAEAIEKYVTNDINVVDTIKRNLRYSNHKLKMKQVNNVLKKLYHALEFSVDMADKLRKGVEHCLEFDKIMEETAGKPEGEKAAQLDALMDKISAVTSVFASRDFYLILMHYVQSFYIKAAMDLNGYRFSNPPSLELNVMLTAKFKEFYSVMALLIDKIVDEFKISIELLEKYKTELQEKK
ncbi:MAG: motility associated factor glycosyltransferase family protein [Deferribacterales bacterium]|nr:motility associated factor glycosyltransferase family protein [Deferribacterales bacterium]